MWVAGRELFPSASLGIAAWHPRYRNGEELLRDADAAMYRAKAQGRDRYAVFDEADARSRRCAAWTWKPTCAAPSTIDDFLPFYQPIVRLEDGAVVGHEALLRWQHERRGLLLPAEFIGLGEDSGLIEQVDWLVYEQVVGAAGARWRGLYLGQRVAAAFPLAAISPTACCRCSTRSAPTLRACAWRSPKWPCSMTRRAPCAPCARLRQHGILAQLDDFGTGFSALSYLHRFPISVLKIDRSFISGIGGEARPESLALVRAILALASTLGIDTIAEGVETEEQKQALIGLGCNLGQGYLLGRPAAQMGGLPAAPLYPNWD